VPVAEPFNCRPFQGHAALFSYKWDKGFVERSRTTFICWKGGRRDKTLRYVGSPGTFPISWGSDWVGLKVLSQPAWEWVYQHHTFGCLPLAGPENCLLINVPDGDRWDDGRRSSPCDGCICLADDMIPDWAKAFLSRREHRRDQFRWNSRRWEGVLSASTDFESALLASVHLLKFDSSQNGRSS
jgi:hypothetical protein